MKKYKRLRELVFKDRQTHIDQDGTYWAVGNMDKYTGAVKGIAIDKLAELEDKLENGTLVELKTCIWEEWEDDLLGSVWCCSNCKEDFCFTEGSVHENNYGYCPHCGAKITELKELKGEV